MTIGGTSKTIQTMHREECVATFVIRSAAALVVVILAALVAFLSIEGTKLFFVDHVSPYIFLTSTNFDPENNAAGSATFILGSLAVTFFALLVGGPLGIAVGIFFAEIAPPRIAALFKPAIEVLVGIPSVVYGWLGLTLLVPFMQHVTHTAGFGILSAGIVLSVMILPTIVTLAEDALRALPESLREGSLALGATRWETISRVLLPAAGNSLAIAIILGIARAIGETLAVQMVIGNASLIPSSLTQAAATLPTEIVMNMAGATEGSFFQHALFAMAFLLLLIAMALIAAVKLSLRKSKG